MSTTSLRASAKQSILAPLRKLDCFVATLPRNDGRRHLLGYCAAAAWFETAARSKSGPRLSPNRSGGRACALPASDLRATGTTAASPPISTAALRRLPDRLAPRRRADRSGGSNEFSGLPRAAHFPRPANNVPGRRRGGDAP